MEFLQNFMNNTNIFLVIILFFIGLLGIIKGGDWFVNSASWIAESTGIPKLIVGATIVSIGTTLPELLVSVIAASSGEYDMAAGNAIGSVTANIAIIMSLSIIFMPSKIKRSDYWIKSVLMFLPLIIMFVFSFRGNVSTSLPLIASVILLVIFVLNIGENVFGAVKNVKLERAEKTIEMTSEQAVVEKITARKLLINIAIFVGGAIAVFVGAQLLQTSATTLATKVGASKQLISLTVVSIGTSLPELVTTITAIKKKEHSLSVGNIIGANIIDLTLILSLCDVISGGSLPMSAQTVLLDIPICMLVSAIAIIPTLITGEFKRWQGFTNLALYLAYLIIMIIGVGAIGIAV